MATLLRDRADFGVEAAALVGEAERLVGDFEGERLARARVEAAAGALRVGVLGAAAAALTGDLAAGLAGDLAAVGAGEALAEAGEALR